MVVFRFTPPTVETNPLSVSGRQEIKLAKRDHSRCQLLQLHTLQPRPSNGLRRRQKCGGGVGTLRQGEGKYHWRPSCAGQKTYEVFMPVIATASKATLGELLPDGVERIWAFPSA